MSERRVEPWADARTPAFLEALLGTGGIVAFAGAGGKKTAIRQIAREHPGPVGVTASVRTAPLRRLGNDVREHEVSSVDEAAAAGRDAVRARCVVALGPRANGGGRREGLSSECIGAFHEAGGFAATLVKADGARMRSMKAPKAGEPILPAGTRRVVTVLGASTLGVPLEEDQVHRPDRLAALTGWAPGAALTPEHVGVLLAHPEGPLQGVGNATAVLLITQVEGDDRQAVALESAQRALDHAPALEAVILASLVGEAPAYRRVVRTA